MDAGRMDSLIDAGREGWIDGCREGGMYEHERFSARITAIDTGH